MLAYDGNVGMKFNLLLDFPSHIPGFMQLTEYYGQNVG